MTYNEKSKEHKKLGVMPDTKYVIPNTNKIRTFKDLDAWKEGHVLVLQIYELTKRFPRSEVFGLTSQMQRCAVSITSNVAEGFSRNSRKEKLQFYAIAQGSVTELQNQLLLAKDVRYISEDQFKLADTQSVRVHKLINGLIRYIRSLIPNT
jgi:four helix bundle protein